MNTNRRQVICWRGGVPVRSYYEGARPDPQRKRRRETGSGMSAVTLAGTSIREQARHLDQNHDIARGILNVLVQNTVGNTGIQINPMPRTRDGVLHKQVRKEIRAVLKQFMRRPEVTHQFSYAAMCRLVARSYFRDGEVLYQHVQGVRPDIDHGKRLPYSIELIEADMLPIDFESITQGRRIRAGIETNAWGKPVNFHLYKEHPGDLMRFATPGDMKVVPADRIEHAKMVDRIGQLRGMSVFAAILPRLDDLKDYEESERIAAKVAASMAAYIKKGRPDDYEDETDENGEFVPRNLRFRPGMIFDDLLPGEEIGTIDTSRPNPQLEPHRNGQVRALAAGTMTTFSSIGKTYNGTFSSQRQELVEGWGAYQILSSDLTDQVVRPMYERAIDMGVAVGLISMPRDLDVDTLKDALYQAPQMPWIDPDKESKSFERLEDNTHASGPEIIRRRGLNPDDVLEEQAAWLEELRERGILTAPDQPVEKNDASRNRS